MNKLIIETKNGEMYWAHVTDSELDDFDSAVMFGGYEYVRVECAKTKQTVVFNRSEISTYSFGELKEASQ
ncbi:MULTISPECIES: hypothetical protein [unclassified Bacillus (in: firmicutes)]|uniref:hypothetical protein n=1 Tax=unclassified Bacillus (in: firmicutes) TaxID=185979 RepID=UPI00163BF793|nr:MULTISPECIES: hypothetical protein [unclassified Bacillus (in: firmicutes)]QNH48725.1 hypothetical protein H7F25_04420 [Bacillus sp. PAMC28571]QNK43020.1 hypothetical protein H7F24_10985 [Bacillus sp. PAMC22265]